MSASSEIAQTILELGRARAQGAANTGAIWGNTLQNLGQTVAAIPGQMQQQKAQAQKFEAAQKAGTAPIGVSSDPVSDSTDLQKQLDQLRMMLGASIINQPQPE